MTLSSLQQEHDLLARNTLFTARVRMASTRYARSVLVEDPDIPGHPLRVSLARTVLSPSSGDFSAPGLAPVIAADPVISAAAAAGHDPADEDSAQASVTDELIVAAVQLAWDLVAGVTPVADSQVVGFTTGR